MIDIFIELIETLLLIGASLLLLFWKLKGKDSNLIKQIGVCVALIGVYKLLIVINNLVQFNELIFSLIKIPELIGILILMFGLFNHLEVKK